MLKQKQRNNLREYDEFLRTFHRKLDFYTYLLDQNYTAPREVSELRTQIQKKMSELESEDLNDELLKQVYLSSLENAREQAIILESRNRKNEMITSGSRKLWGEPDYKNYRKAINLLKKDKILEKEIETLEREKILDSHTVKKWLGKILHFFDIEGWTVNLNENTDTISVSSANRKLNLPSNRKFSQREAFRLALHEIGRHVLTFENGQKQDYKVLAYGVGDYEKIDEGIAAYMEKRSGLMTERVFKKYAARLVSVYQMNNGYKRRETKKNLQKLSLDPQLAENIVDRVFLGGGLSRDHIYLEGLFKAESYLNKNSLNDFFIGKVPLKFTRELKKRRDIETPDRDMEKLTENFYDEVKPIWDEEME